MPSAMSADTPTKIITVRAMAVGDESIEDKKLLKEFSGFAVLVDEEETDVIVAGLSVLPPSVSVALMSERVAAPVMTGLITTVVEKSRVEVYDLDDVVMVEVIVVVTLRTAVLDRAELLLLRELSLFRGLLLVSFEFPSCCV